MTFAWYGHLKHLDSPLWKMILVSWLIAGFEYLFQVPANRIGAEAGWNGFQLKITQEAITITVFVIFAILYLKERPQWNHALAFILILGAVALVFGPKNVSAKPSETVVIPQSDHNAALPEQKP
jgi:uncharacterized protein (DUF486 family)